MARKATWLPQNTNIYKIYSKSTIDTGMLMHICKVIGYNFFDLLSEEYKKQKNG